VVFTLTKARTGEHNNNNNTVSLSLSAGLAVMINYQQVCLSWSVIDRLVRTVLNNGN